jgi:lipopolysaccharide export system protein LptA
MKAQFLTLICGALLMAWMPLPAQMADTDDSGEPQPPAGSTLITSDELHSDQVTHVSVFTGHVVVVGTNFHMTCQEMTVNFTKDNKVDTIIAVGDVVIVQPGRVTNCGRADYFHDEDKFILTDQPVIHDHDNIVSGPKIIIYRTTQKMEVIGHSNVILGPNTMKSSPSTNAPSATPAGALPQ